MGVGRNPTSIEPTERVGSEPVPERAGRPLCSAAKKDGDPCTAIAMSGRATCLAHTPEMAERRRRGNALGGLVSTGKRWYPEGTPVPCFETEADVQAFLADVAHKVMTGGLPTQVASTLAYLVSVSLKAADLSARATLAALQLELERRGVK